MNTRLLLHLALLAIIATVSASCATPAKTASINTPFDMSAHADFAKPGKAVVIGQAFHRTRGGDVKYAAGREVTLAPATAYGEEIIEILSKGMVADNFAPGWNALLKSTVSDGLGEFSFHDVPAGRWYVVTQNYWEAGPHTPLQGGFLGQVVRVPIEGEVKVVITGPPW